MNIRRNGFREQVKETKEGLMELRRKIKARKMYLGGKCERVP